MEKILKILKIMEKISKLWIITEKMWMGCVVRLRGATAMGCVVRLRGATATPPTPPEQVIIIISAEIGLLTPPAVSTEKSQEK